MNQSEMNTHLMEMNASKINLGEWLYEATKYMTASEMRKIDINWNLDFVVVFRLDLMAWN